MSVAMPRLLLIVMLAGAMTACSPTVAIPLAAPPAAATVDGQAISMAAYHERLNVSQARDPFAGMPEAIPSPVPRQRLEDFTISDQAVTTRVAMLENGSASFSAAIARNGFTRQSFQDYERALLTEVGLLHAMAKQRAGSAMSDLHAGQSFDSVVAKWNDDSGTAARHGEVGWVRPGDLPEPELANAVQGLATGATSGVIATGRGFAIVKALERRDDQVRLALILVLAPTVDMLSPQGTPAWFTKFIDDQESALRRDGKITVSVGSRAGA